MEGSGGAAFAVVASPYLVPQTQDYPTRPVKMIVPYPAGGTTDILPRIMQEWLSRKWASRS